MKRFLQSWLICTLAVLVAVYLVPGVQYQKPVDLIIASLLLGILNAVLRPVLMLLALPLLVFTLGLFLLVINALLLYLVGLLLQPGFSVANFWAAFWGALVISLVSSILNFLTGRHRGRVVVRRRKTTSSRDGRGGSGPVIDV